MHQVTRWFIAEELSKKEGEITVKQLAEKYKLCDIDEFLEGLREYLIEAEHGTRV